MPTYREDLHLGHKPTLVETDDLMDKGITTDKLDDAAVTTPKIDDKAITTPKLDNKSVTTPKLGDASVTTPKIADDSVTTPKLGDDSVTTPKIADKNVTWDKLDDDLQNVIASRKEGGVALSNKLGNSELLGITQKKLTEEITDIKGQVGSIADEEDLTVVKKAGLTKQVELKLKDKAYDPDVHSGMGRKYLRKNNVVVGGIPFMGIVENVNAAGGDEEEIIDEVFFDRVRERFVGAIVSLDPATQTKSYSFLMQWEDYGTMAYSLYVPISSSRMYDLNGVPYKWSGTDLVVYDGADRGEKVKNVLTQAMLQDADGHNLENTIFHIQYDYTLDGESIEVPTGSILLFEGGSISNGTLTGDFTVVKAIGTEVFNNVTLPGNVESIDKEVADLKAMDNDLSGRITEEANRAMGSETNLQQGIGSLDSRLQQVEGLAELSVEGGQIGIASATDFTNRTTEGDLKIPTVGAILNAADEEPTAGSDNLVKSGGVQNELALGAVYDVSAKNPTAGSNNDGKFESLSALLSDANLNTLIPAAVRKGGMSIKFIQSSDNKYIQARCMAQNFTTDITAWQNMGDFVEEKEHLIADNEVAGYLTDKNKSVIAKLMKNGAVEWLVENSKDIANSIRFESIEELLSYVSSEVPDSGNSVIKYLTDKDGTVIATINNVGDTEFKGGGGFDGEITTSQSISFDAIKVITDRKGSVIGWINSNGKVHIEELDVRTITSGSGIGIPDQILSVLGFVASGTDNYKFVNDRTYALFKSMAGEYVKDGVEIETVPTISIQDDDSIDYQLPESYIPGATASTQPDGNEKRGGFASLLFPILKSLNIKHAGEINGGKITCASVAEGQRIGLTPYRNASDEFNGQLNSCGKIIKGLIEKEGWEVICHSMTVREGWERHSYLVNGLDSEFAQSLLVNATYSGEGGFSTYTTTCYDTVTKKNYMVKPIPAGETDSPGWDELPDKYIKQYLQLTKAADSHLVVNPSYSVKYQVRTWQERAKQAGLPWVTLLTAWGDSHSSWHCREDMKYVNTVFASGSTWNVNTVPFHVNPNRNPLSMSPSVNGIIIPPNQESFYNVYNAYDYKKFIKHIDNVKATKGWSILRPHMYVGEFVNYYRAEYEDLYGVESAECGPMCYKDDNYPQEWITPLNHDELIDMVGENVHDYWNNPPARLGISSWDEWYPCPGTSCALIYDILEYAISQGIYFSRSEDVLSKYCNLFALGYENVVVLQPDKYLLPQYVDNSYCRIGADGSFTYVSK